MADLRTTALEKRDGLMTRRTITAPAASLLELARHYMTGDSTIGVWQLHEVRWGRLTDGTIHLYENAPVEEAYIQEVRIFNANEELHLYRRQDSYTGRYVRDEGAEAVSYVDSFSRLWGERQGEVQDGFVTLRDAQRFLQMPVPVDAVGTTYGLVTRNYIHVDEKTGQAGFGDYRYVRIDAAEGGNE